MAASYPSATKSFTPIVDGTDYPQATQINQVYDEVTAVEQALLTNGLLHAIGVGVAVQSDVQLQVIRAAGTSGHKAAQIDMSVASGTGGSHYGLQVNCKTPAGSTWDGTSGFLFAGGYEAGTRTVGSATIMGLNVQGKIWSGGTGNSLNVVEINCCSEEAPTSRVALTIAAVPTSELPTTENTASAGLDTALLIGAKRYGAKFATGIHFFQTAGAEAATGFRWPIQTTGTLIKATPGEAVTVAAGIDFSSSDLTISGSAFKSTGFDVTGAGLVNLVRASALTTAQLKIEDTSTGDAVLHWRVADTTSWYLGVDNSDGDKLKLGTAEGFGSGLALVADSSGNVGVSVGTFGTDAAKVLGLTNGTAPTTSPADMVQLFSVDAAGAGTASLGLRTEAAVVTESVTSDTTLQVTINGTVYKLCLKA